MTDNPVTAPLGRFTLISLFATLWYLLGCAMWFMQVSMEPEAIAELSAGEQTFYNSLPGWYNVVFGIGVFVGLAGCIALLLRRTIALPLFMVSLGVVLVQNIYGFTTLGAMELLGTASIIVPVLVIGIGGLMIWFAYTSRALSHIN